MARAVARVEGKAMKVVEQTPVVAMQPAGQRRDEFARAALNVGVRITRSRITPSAKASSEPTASLPMATTLPATKHVRNSRPIILASRH